MADQLQLRGGTNYENQSFTGAQREVVVDTDNHELIVHDGVEAGGHRQASQKWVSDSTIFFDDNVSGGSAADAYILAAKDNTRTPSAYTDGLELGFVTSNANTGSATADFAGLGAKSIKYEDGSDLSAGDINGRVLVIYDEANDWLEYQKEQLNPNIVFKNVANVFTAKQTVSGSHALTSSSNSVAVDLSHQYYTLDMTEDTVLAAPSNVTARQLFSLEITQDDTTAYTLGYNTFYQFANGSAPAISEALSSKQRLVCEVSEDGSYAACNLLTDIGNS